MEKITFVTEDGESVEFYVEEQTTISGVSYLLVSDSDAEEANAYILKDVSPADSADACYEMVEDETEAEAVFSVFREILEDIDCRA